MGLQRPNRQAGDTLNDASEGSDGHTDWLVHLGLVLGSGVLLILRKNAT